MKNRFLRLFPLLLLAVLIVWAFPHLRGLTAQEILSYSPEQPLLAALFLAGIYCAKSIAVFIPVTVLYMAGGVMFPAWQAILITYLGLALELTIGFWIGRQLDGRKLVARLEQGKQMKKLAPKVESSLGWLNGRAERLPAICFFLRVIPGPLPLDVLNMLFGSTGLKFLPYLAISLLGLTPGMIPWVIAGGSIATPFSKEFLLPFGIGLAVAALAFCLYRFLRQKYSPETEEES